MDGLGSRLGDGGGVSLHKHNGNGRRFGMTDLALTLAPVPDSVPAARHWLDGLAAHLDEYQLDNLRLLVSEVVSNSVRHGDGAGPIDLRITIERSGVRVEVEDPGPGFRPPPEIGPVEGNEGWGLLLVERLADRWGVVASGSTLVWFELDRLAG
jgi:anti-sigma regulatory factor (Ser/Thr protein kinase)